MLAYRSREKKETLNQKSAISWDNNVHLDSFGTPAIITESGDCSQNGYFLPRSKELRAGRGMRFGC